MFQMPFMRRSLEESVDFWNSEPSEDSDRAAAQRGLVTDGDMSYFRGGVLLCTCVFNPVMQAWVPALYTWILKQDAEHHRPHFRLISQQIVSYVQSQKMQFQDHYLLHVR